MKTIEYFVATASPWTYLGHERLIEIAGKHGAQIVVKPMDLGRVFPVSGGLPLGQRAPQRQAYRLVDLPRWAAFRRRPLNLHPKYFPVDGHPSARWIIAAEALFGQPAALRLTGAVLAGVWAGERNIADPAELAAIATGTGLDAAALSAGAARPETQATYDRYTREAIDLQVFGAPWYVVNGEPFWGQDRLELLELALAR